MLVMLDTSQYDIPLLNDDAKQNTDTMFITLDTSQDDTVLLKDDAR